MSQIIAPVGASSLLKLLKYHDRIDAFPFLTMWWRQRLYPREDGTFCTMEVDDPDNPTQATVTWCDRYGDDDDILEPYAVRVTNKEPEESLYRGRPLVTISASFTYFLDVLWHSKPTTGWWEQLTAPGQHVHPDERQYIDEQRRKLLAETLAARAKADRQGRQS